MSKANTLELQMLDLINAERIARGLDPLQLELRLNDAAEDHSRWMIETDTFSHTGVGGSSPTQRIRDADFDLSGSWLTAENVAWQSERGASGLADDVANLHQSLMNSPGHRANILNAKADYIGIGIERGDFKGWDGVFVTQNFATTSAPVAIDPGASAPQPSDPTPPAPSAPQDPAPSVARLQIGEETVSQANPDTWHSVTFDNRIDDAVVVMGPLSANGGQPATVRVQNVTDTGFQFRIEEWEYLDGKHVTETVGWMAMSEGTHQLADGRTVMAGTSATDHNFSRVAFGDGFEATPFVFGQAVTNRGDDAVTLRLDDVSSDGFDFRLQEEEARGAHVTEQVDWIAFEGGTSSLFDVVDRNGVTHTGTATAHGNDEVLLAQMQTFNGSDTADLRFTDRGANSRLWVQEEASQDTEMRHAGEDVAILTAGTGVYDLFA